MCKAVHTWRAKFPCFGLNLEEAVEAAIHPPTAPANGNHHAHGFGVSPKPVSALARCDHNRDRAVNADPQNQMLWWGGVVNLSCNPESAPLERHEPGGIATLRLL